MAEQLICNQQVVGSSPTIGFANLIGIYPFAKQFKKLMIRKLLSIISTLLSVDMR